MNGDIIVGIVVGIFGTLLPGIKKIISFAYLKPLNMIMGFIKEKEKRIRNLKERSRINDFFHNLEEVSYIEMKNFVDYSMNSDLIGLYSNNKHIYSLIEAMEEFLEIVEDKKISRIIDTANDSIISFYKICFIGPQDKKDIEKIKHLQESRQVFLKSITGNEVWLDFLATNKINSEIADIYKRGEDSDVLSYSYCVTNLEKILDLFLNEEKEIFSKLKEKDLKKIFKKTAIN